MHKPWRKLYKTKAWKSLRLECFKRDIFICQTCGEHTQTEHHTQPNAAICDHKIAHKGNEVLFYNINNTQTLCKSCHDGDKQRQEIHGYSNAIGEDGWPIDEQHPFNR